MKLPTITILAAAATICTASLANAGPAPRRGYDAYASAAAVADASPWLPDAARASALRECNKAVANRILQIWGVQESDVYRACMASHGQVE